MVKKTEFLALVLVLGILFVPLAIAYSPKEDIDKVKEKHQPEIVSIQGVSGIYADKEANEIVVLVENDATAGKVPKELEGIKVRTAVTGRIYAYRTILQPLQTYSRTGINTPVFGGISLGSASIYCSSGTLGIVTANSQHYILSAAHVLALNYSADPVSPNPTWQPGGADTNCGSGSFNVVGTLASYMPITFFNDNGLPSYNYADAAVATINNGYFSSNMVDKELNKYNNGFYTVSGITTVNYGNRVRKSGRTTGVTTGMVVSNNAVVQVYYTSTKYAWFDDQIVVYSNSFSRPGDSGSVVDMNGQWVGLLFAGGGPYTIISKASYIAAPLANGGLGVTLG